MSVLDGPRREVRRVMHGGSACWATPVPGGLRLGDGRVVPEDEVRHLPPCAPAITLVPGDVILTGTPANSRLLDPGDVIEVEVTGLGRLRNHVVAAPAPRAKVGHQPTDTDEVRRVALRNDARLPPRVRGGA